MLAPLGRRLDAVFIKDPLDGRPADLVAEEAHHVPDSRVAPAHVLLGQPDYEVPNVLRLRRAPRAALGVAIVLGARVLAEPPGQRVWGDERAELPKLGVGEGPCFQGKPAALSLGEAQPLFRRASPLALESPPSGTRRTLPARDGIQPASIITIAWAAVLQKFNAIMRPIIRWIGRSGGLSAAG